MFLKVLRPSAQKGTREPHLRFQKKDFASKKWHSERVLSPTMLGNLHITIYTHLRKVAINLSVANATIPILTY